MNVLLVHQSFPSQFRGLAPALIARGDTVVALGMDATVPEAWEGIRIIKYPANRSSSKTIHPWLGTYETHVIRGDSCFLAAKKLKGEGFTPDVIVVHPGWGEALFIDQVWPGIPIILYCEYFYSVNRDSGFDPDFPTDAEIDGRRLQVKNTTNIMSFESASVGVSPTQWQANTYPERLREKIQVIHDGVDTTTVKPNENAQLLIKGKLKLTRQDEVLTFVNRNLEPYRGYHVFMRALPALLRQRPKMQVLIVGGDKVSYGSPSPDGRSWKEVFFTEVEPKLSGEEKARIHFLGQLPFSKYLGLLQVSTVHVYLTYPFVLSWSLLEAMSAGCAIVASNTDPVKEFIKDSVHGLLVDFFDTQALIEQINFLMDSPVARQLMGIQARHRIQKNYDFKTCSLPRWLDLITTASQKRVVARSVHPVDRPFYIPPVNLVVATRLSKNEFLANSPTGKSITFYKKFPANFGTIVTLNNKRGLSDIYNKAIDATEDENMVLVFAHDDLYFHDFYWVEKIIDGLKTFDVVGLAGNVRRLPRQPSWAFVNEKFDWDVKANLSGTVGHGHGFPPKNLSKFGVTPQKVKLLDGLLIAITKKTLQTSGLRFDPQFDFHFYDLDFCRQAEKLGLTCGTLPISITHASGGSMKSESWQAGYKKYLAKWGD